MVGGLYPIYPIIAIAVYPIIENDKKCIFIVAVHTLSIPYYIRKGIKSKDKTVKRRNST